MTETCLSCRGALEVELHPVYDTRFGVPEPYGIARCTQCGLEQTLPRPTGPQLGELYSKHYNFGGEKGTLYTELRAKFLLSPIYRLYLALDGDISFHARPAPVQGGRLLDIGCNEGRGLQLYARNGFDRIEGLETNPVAAASARAKGFTVYGVELADFRPTERYDVCVLSNVLEHALDPAEMLADVARVLKPGGQVWISCPNAASLARTIFGTAWINWHVPFHIVHFTASSLRRTLEKSGFTLRDEGQITPALWIAHSILAAIAAKPGQPTRLLRKPIAVLALMAVARGLLFPLLWAMNRTGHGDCLIAVAEAPTASAIGQAAPGLKPGQPEAVTPKPVF